MLTLYGVARSRASRNLWLLHEMGRDFAHVPVIQAYRLADPAATDAALNTRSPAFLTLSPRGTIPVLDDDGLVLAESLAINLHLGRRFGGPLAPADAGEWSRAEEWSLYAATAIEPSALAILNLDPGTDDPAIRAEIERHAAVLRRPLAVLDAHLAAEGQAMGGRFTLADIALAETLRYAQGEKGLIEAFPAVATWLAACQNRPAFRRMWQQRLDEPA